MAKRTPKPKPRPEREVLSEIMGFLAVCHITHRRINSGMIMQSYKGRSRPVRFGAPGMADVWAVLPGGGGRTWWIETKRVGEVQTDKQREFEAEVVAAGCVYTVAYGLEDVRKVLEACERKPREIQMTHSAACGCGCQAKRAPALCVECGDTGAIEVDGVDRMCPACRGAVSTKGGEREQDGHRSDQTRTVPGL